MVEGDQKERQLGEGVIETTRLVVEVASEGGECRPRAKDGAGDRHHEHGEEEEEV